MRDPTTPCWICRYFDGMANQTTTALCNCPGACRVRSSPERGCCNWEREPGCDDKPGPPEGFRVPEPWAPILQPAR
jgi:hypothetical protein